MGRNSNGSNTGNYVPAHMSLAKQDLAKAFKGIKVKAPNRKLSTQSYKSALPKLYESSGNG